MLEATAVTLSFGRHQILNGVSLAVSPGETLGLAGPSGCGKSTLARVLALLLRPSGGTVTLDGQPIIRWRHRARQRTSIGLIFQQPRLAVDPRFTLLDVIAEPLRARRTARPLVQRECPRLAAPPRRRSRGHWRPPSNAVLRHRRSACPT
jgi:peptide/nickel transport system ATP-binding protein